MKKNRCTVVHGDYFCTGENCIFFVPSDVRVLFAGNLCQHSRYQDPGTRRPAIPHLYRCLCKDAHGEK